MPVSSHYYGEPESDGARSTLESMGPTLPVAISLSPVHARLLTEAGQPVPSAITGLAIIDTGAATCLVDEAAMRALGIPVFGRTPHVGATGSADLPTYPASLSFPGTALPSVTFFDFAATHLSQLGLIALIGRNVLANFVLVYNGPGGHVTVAY